MADAFDVSRESLGRLQIYVDLLGKWNASINLVADASPEIVWRRHIADSLQIRRFIPHGISVIDLGSGAGFPGLPLAILFGPNPSQICHLVESNRKKCAFLLNAIRLTDAAAVVHATRIESVATQELNPPPGVITARAVAPLTKLLELSEVFLRKGAIAVFLKGQDVGSELTEAAKSWRIEADIHPSVVDPSGRVVVVHQARFIGQ
ncbi:16S rRNA (guanine527-N7)-methyltransferase [Rhodoligotrophos appendicifer]|uniref:16S rRNA (guanine(527)-N(7))-methyltransferase RsmG n=1 Tax=Rhodoligotrophos appendicifer TaxID=987056 RepID=UPI0019620842|nr:16S rRNA (guanine(527)-N(7))-methyltransferase RsmG [Rhodoligotrophos appendicifer]